MLKYLKFKYFVLFLCYFLSLLTITHLIIYMKKLLDSDWLISSVTSVQKV